MTDQEFDARQRKQSYAHGWADRQYCRGMQPIHPEGHPLRDPYTKGYNAADKAVTAGKLAEKVDKHADGYRQQKREQPIQSKTIRRALELTGMAPRTFTVNTDRTVSRDKSTGKSFVTYGSAIVTFYVGYDKVAPYIDKCLAQGLNIEVDIFENGYRMVNVSWPAEGQPAKVTTCDRVTGKSREGRP